jgi:hypothetical protein
MGITTTGTAGTARIAETVNVMIGSKGGSSKNAAQKAEEDEEWGGNVLDAMIDKVGTRKEVQEDIRDHRRKCEFAQRLANFSHADEDGNPVMMTKNATQGFGASSRDANYSEKCAPSGKWRTRERILCNSEMRSSLNGAATQVCCLQTIYSCPLLHVKQSWRRRRLLLLLPSLPPKLVGLIYIVHHIHCILTMSLCF